MNEAIVGLAALMIPIVGVLVMGAIIIAALSLKYKSRRERFALYHQERMAALDKGIDLPPLQAPANLCRYRSPRRHLLIGLILTFAGVAMVIAFQNSDQEGARAGAIPMAIGLAFLVFYALVGRKEAALYDASQKLGDKAP